MVITDGLYRHEYRTQLGRTLERNRSGEAMTKQDGKTE